jgi:hypothetical protein
MHSLRSTRLLARLVLAWFVAVVGVAAAAPAWHPQSLDLVCTGAGMKLVAVDAGDGEPVGAGGLDCPLCATVVPPPPVHPAAGLLPEAPLAQVQPAVPAAAAAMPSPPARGPPSRLA